MRRASLLLLMTIVVLAGITAHSVVARRSSGFEAARNETAISTAIAFYDALDGALQGGSPDSLADQLSTIFVDHDAATGADRSAQEFLADVGGWAAQERSGQLQVVSVEPAGGNVIAHVAYSSEHPLTSAGLMLVASPAMPSFEVLRVVGGRIVDRWSSGFGWPRLTVPAEQTEAFSSSIGLKTTLWRIELTGSEEQTWSNIGIGMAIVETGAASIAYSGETTHQPSTLVDAGEMIWLPSAEQVRLRSADGAPLSVLVYQVSGMGASSSTKRPAETDAPQGGIRRILWSQPQYGADFAVVPHPARVELPPGRTFQVERPAGMQVTVAVTSGALEVSLQNGDLAMMGPNGWPVDVDGSVRLEVDEVVWAEHDGTLTLHNPTDFPITLLLVATELLAPTSETHPKIG